MNEDAAAVSGPCDEPVRPAVRPPWAYGAWSPLLPGLLLALLTALIGGRLSVAAGEVVLRMQGLDPVGRASPFSAIPFAVVLGLVVANTLGVRPTFAPGLDFTMKTVLRAGIILVGLKLSIADVLHIGVLGVPVVVSLVVLTLVATLLLARWMGMSSNLGVLAAASTAICGITATVTVAPTIEADSREVAYTVANVTMFGLVAMLAYPYLAHALFGGDSGAAGLFLGTAVHDTSQVMGAALSYREIYGDERALQVATVAKLTRNALLVVVVPVLAWHAGRGRERAGARRRWTEIFPVFLLGFLALSVLRSVGDITLGSGGAALGVLSAREWSSALSLLGEKSATLLLATALAGVGLTTRLSVLRELGIRPLALGLAAALLVGGMALAAAMLVSPLLG